MASRCYGLLKGSLFSSRPPPSFCYQQLPALKPFTNPANQSNVDVLQNFFVKLGVLAICVLVVC